MEDTWWSRDLPVLDAAVELFEDEDFVEVRDLSEATGFEPKDVARALLGMRGVFVGEIQSMGDMDQWCITEVTPAARRAVGQWPTPENVVARLAEAFSAAADHEPDHERRGKLRALGSFLGETGKDFAAEVVARSSRTRPERRESSLQVLAAGRAQTAARLAPPGMGGLAQSLI